MRMSRGHLRFRWKCGNQTTPPTNGSCVQISPWGSESLRIHWKMLCDVAKKYGSSASKGTLFRLRVQLHKISNINHTDPQRWLAYICSRSGATRIVGRACALLIISGGNPFYKMSIFLLIASCCLQVIKRFYSTKNFNKAALLCKDPNRSFWWQLFALYFRVLNNY